MSEAGEEMCILEVRCAVDPASFRRFGESAATGLPQRQVQQLTSRHGEAGLLAAEAFGESRDHLVVGARILIAVQHGEADIDVGVAQAIIEVVVFQECRGGQQDIGVLRGRCRKLLVYAKEQIIARQAAPHGAAVACDVCGIGVLHQHRHHRRPALQIGRVAAQHRTDA